MKKVNLSANFDIAGIYGMEGCFGGFMWGGGEPEWFHCREAFQTDIRNPSVFFYWTLPANQKKVIAYVKRAEDMLGLKPGQRCVISYTNLKNILHVKIGSFWRRRMSLSLLTILFRDGRNYNGRAFWATAKQGVYLRGSAMLAFRRFMAGYTNFSYKVIKGDKRNAQYYEDYYGYDYDIESGYKLCLDEGWCSNFEYITQKTIDKVLLKPKKKGKSVANRKRTKVCHTKVQRSRKPVRRKR